MNPFRRPSVRYGATPEAETPYQRAAQVWDERIGSARVQARNWRLMAFGSLFLSAGLAFGLVWQSARGSVVPWVVQIDKIGQAQAVAPAVADYRPNDPQIAWHLARFIEQIRSIPVDPVIVRQNWLRAYEFTTDRGAMALNDFARANDPFAKVGKRQVAIEVSSVIRASPELVPRRLVRARLREQPARRDRALDRDPHHRRAAAARCRPPEAEPARHLRQRHQLVEGAWMMKPPFRRADPSTQSPSRSARMRTPAMAALMLGAATLGGCAQKFIPPDITYDDFTPAVHAADLPTPVTIVELPKPLPLPGQLKPVPAGKAKPEPKDPRQRITQANAAARVQPVRDGFINAVQVYPYSAGALYQVYTAPGQVTDVALQPGEQLVGSGPVAAGDTVRWIIGDTESGTGPNRKVHILVKPTRPDLQTNLVINTDRRTYHLELLSTEKTYMASVSWQYPQDQLVALRRQNAAAVAAQPVATGIDISALNFRYTIEGDTPPWRPLRAFDDGSKVYIEFPSGIRQGEMPPLFIIGPGGESELVNYRARQNYYVVDRLFAAAELRLGDRNSERRVRIVRTDGRRRS